MSLLSTVHETGSVHLFGYGHCTDICPRPATELETTVSMPRREVPYGSLDVCYLGNDRIDQGRTVRNGRMFPTNPQHRRSQIVKERLLNRGGHFRSHPTMSGGLTHHDQTVGVRCLLIVAVGIVGSL
jgi:hypothetical protein